MSRNHGPSRRRPHSRSYLAALLAPIVLAGTALGAGLAAAPASADAPSLDGVYINEVESNNDAVHGDWIELINTNGASVDLTGAILSDNDNSHELVLGAVALPGDGIMAFRTDDPSVAGSFGLGSADSARLFPAGTTDLATATPVDSYSWTSHATTTYGRNWDDDGAWETTAYGTFGEANVFPGQPVSLTGIKLNEVESDDPTGGGDWVELYNTSDQDVSLTGAYLSDSEDTHVMAIPAQTIASHGYAVIRTDDPTVPGSFGLGSSDEIRLFPSNDVTATPTDAFSWTQHATVTWGRTVPGTGDWAQTTVATPGAANDFTPVDAPDISGVRINEVKTTGDDTNGDWIELKNTGSTDADLSQAILSDNDDSHVFRIPSGTTLAAGAVQAFKVDDPALASSAFGLGDDDEARLFRADTVDLTHPSAGQEVDHESWTTHATTSYGLTDAGVWTTTHRPTFGQPNDFTSTITPDISWVVLNEIESSDPAGGPDWIELYNTSDQPISLAGAQLSDSDDGHDYVIPSGTTIAAHGYYTVDIDQVSGGFGLGSDDAVRFYRAGKVVGTDYPLDHFEWTQHAATSYGRSDLGLGDWSDQSCGTSKGAANCS